MLFLWYTGIFKEPLNIVTNLQYAERVALHIEAAEFIPDDTELTSLFTQVQDIIRNRFCPIHIIHIHFIQICQVLKHKVMQESINY